ncbi:dapper homolog 1 isoform X2 [Cyclopterus lumpus]|uniref:dapper homolog 1 isoform X2 n=1 Tax=Cyclopterus lumpus TaxID=8103 RepID=UPI0014864E54|nr:dapper homolog 1 isoform X2 [Cyclopterus lumpus]
MTSRRERLEATVSGLGELEYLRQRQEVLVRAALELQQEEKIEKEEKKEEEKEKKKKKEKEETEKKEKEEPRSSEEKLLEENILLLRKQLNCLRRRDAGLISQLQELDRQISDLRLDSEASHDHQETDSRPSSGFYELSDGVSLSNSSNSVFSECFCSTAEADGRLLSADELASCLDCDCLVGGLCDDLSSSVRRRSLSVPYPASPDPASSVDSSKYHCDLIARNGSDIYRYPSPLHAVAVQSPVFLQMEGHRVHGGPGRDGVVEGLKPESSPLSASDSAPLVSQSSARPTSSSQAPSYKRLDSYICSLLQRRALPFRTSRPRTSISADPSKSILRQASLCVMQLSGSGFRTLRKFDFKPCGPTGGASAGGAAPLSSQRQWSVDSKSVKETQNVFPDNSVDSMQNIFRMNNKDSAQNQNISPSGVGLQRDSSVTNQDIDTSSKTLPPPSAVSDFRGLGSPKANSSPKETKEPCYSPDPDLLLKSPAVIKTAAPKNSPKHPQTLPKEKDDMSVLEVAGSSSQSQDEAGGGGGGGGGGGSHMVNAKSIPAQQHIFKLHKASKNVKTVKMKTTTTMSRGSEHNEPPSERRGDKSHHRSGSKKSRLLDDRGSVNTKVSKRASGAPGASISWIKRLPASIQESRVLDKQGTSTTSSVQSGASRHHHHHGHHHHRRDQVLVVAKLKYKRNDYRQLRAIAEVSRPYSYVAGSDSEYSAECASLFHSTIADSSEDERSNCTTNRFGDSESGEEEYVEESSTSDTEESGGGGSGCKAGGMGQGRSQSGGAGARVAGLEMTPAQPKAFVKIKASHHLKKKILRFRSGSLKLMTTV